MVFYREKRTKADTDLILRLKEEELGKKIIFLSKIKRNKVYLLLQNTKSQRYYSVSADRCHYKNFILSQIEIEYKGIVRTKKTRRKSVFLEKLVDQEIALLSNFIIRNKKMNTQFKLKKTNKTKFEWICSCISQEKK